MPKKAPFPEIVVCSPLDMARALSMLSWSQTQMLADLSGIPFTTLYKRAGSRQMWLSTAYHVAKHLPTVLEMKLPGRGEYQKWRRMQRLEAVRQAREVVAAKKV